MSQYGQRRSSRDLHVWTDSLVAVVGRHVHLRIVEDVKDAGFGESARPGRPITECLTLTLRQRMPHVYESFRTFPDLSGTFRTFPDLSEPIRTFPDLSGPFRTLSVCPICSIFARPCPRVAHGRVMSIDQVSWDASKAFIVAGIESSRGVMDLSRISHAYVMQDLHHCGIRPHGTINS